MRSLRWAFIFFQCLWLNVVVPGHTRGAFAMPGSKTVGSAVESDSCCATKHARPGTPEKSDKPLDRDRCAVCHYALGLTLPPVFSFDHQPAGLVGVAPVLPVETPSLVPVRLATSERGPPIT